MSLYIVTFTRTRFKETWNGLCYEGYNVEFDTHEQFGSLEAAEEFIKENENDDLIENLMIIKGEVL